MTPDQYARVEALFEAALAQPEQVRAMWLREQCPDDPEVLRKVEGMLALDASTLAALEAPAMGAGFHVGNADEIEQRIREEFAAAGRYQVESLLGEGGFGTVYRAAQIKPVRRHVALKVIKLGMDTRRILARFEAERQTLAMMNHPGIAKFLDAGTTASGRSFFVMELVEGRPITSYCDERHVDTRSRLELFGRVCDAIRHAHQKGVLHRDIKPSNVLVTIQDGRPSPVVIDFGIARALDDDSGAMSLVTEHGQIIGTPEYMSPEQAEGSRDIDTRTDVYSLGVLLYELLTGSTPFERSSRTGSSLAEWQRLIRELDPPTPSTRVRKSGERGAMAAKGRASDQAALSRMLQGDLDWIVMKAIEKDRSLRYESVDALAADLNRYLSDEPVLARPQSAVYRFKKFARRNRAALGAALGMLLLLVGGVVGTSVGMVRALAARDREAAERRRADEKAAIATAVTNFLNEDLLSALRPDEQGKDVTMRQVLDEATRRLEGRFPNQPEVEASVRVTIGGSFMHLGVLDAAEKQFTKAHELRKRAVGEKHADTMEAVHYLAKVHNLQGRYAESEAALLALLEHERDLNGPECPNCLNILGELANVLRRQGRLAESEQVFRELLDIRRRVSGEEHEDTLLTYTNLAALLRTTGQLDEAASMIERTLELQRKKLGPQHTHTMFTLGSLAVLNMQRGQLDASEALFDELLPAMKQVLGEEHPYTLFASGDLALLYVRQERLSDAEALYTSALDGLSRVLGAEHPETLITMEHLGEVYLAQDRLDEARSLLSRVVHASRRIHGHDHPYTAASALKLAKALEQATCIEEAESELSGLVDGARRTRHARLTEFLEAHGRVLTRMGRYETAEAALLQLADARARSTAPGAADRWRAACAALVDLYESWDRADEAGMWTAMLAAQDEAAGR